MDLQIQKNKNINSQSYNPKYISGEFKPAYNSIQKNDIDEKQSLERLIENKNLDQICNNILNLQVQNVIKVKVFKFLKQSIRKGQQVEYYSLINLLKKFNHFYILYALAYKIKNCIEPVDIIIIQEIEELISQNSNIEAKCFLDKEIKIQKNLLNDKWLERKNRFFEEKEKFKVYQPKRLQVAVTKTQQVNKTHYKQNYSEEVNVNILNLTEALKNKKQKKKIIPQAEKVPELIKDEAGNDESFWSGTYTNVKLLYNIANQKGVLKASDKNTYLAEKYFGGNNFWFTSNILDTIFRDTLFGIFITNRLISAIYCKISQKQDLCDKVIQKLELWFSDLESLKKQILGTSDPILIAQNLAKCRSLVNRYYQNSNEPLIIQRIAKNLISNGTRDTDYINNFIQIQIQEMRIEAAHAFYNCALRNNTLLNKDRILLLERRVNDPDTKFRAQIMKILCLNDNLGVDYKVLFQQCLSDLEQNTNTTFAISFIINQTKDIKRCQELFNDEIKERLCKILFQQNFDVQIKMQCCEAINNYLEYFWSQGLTDQEQINFCGLILNIETNEELKFEALKSILLTSEKRNQLTQTIIILLVDNMEIFNDYIVRLIILVLGKVVKNSCNISLDKLSNKLLDDDIAIIEGADIKFEPWSKENQDFPSISQIVAKIFVETQPNENVSEIGFFGLIQALNSINKQTRIQSAKALYLLAPSKKVSDLVLISIRDYVNDQITDVSTYSILAYIIGINTLLMEKISVSPCHLEYISKISTLEELKIGEEDFTDLLYQNILSTLLQWNIKETFDQNVIEFLYHIFSNENGKFLIEAAKILQKYTELKFQIPANLILSIENLLEKPEVYSISINILEKIIHNGQAVNERSLQAFSDILYFSDDETLRLNSLKLLEVADDNQELSDEIFVKLEIQRSIQIINSNKNGMEDSFSYLITKTGEGQKLPIDGFLMLNNYIKNYHSLLIIRNISENEQSVPDYIIDQLVQEFNPNHQYHSILIQIFAKMAKNNQNLPKELLHKLENSLEEESLSEEVLSIFVYSIKCVKNYSITVLNKMCKIFLITKNENLQYELLFVIINLIGENKITQDQIKKVLINGITRQNSKVIMKSVDGFIKYSQLNNLDSECLDFLVNLAISQSSEEPQYFENLNKLLRSCQLNNKQSTKLELAKLNTQNYINSQSEFLKQISKLQSKNESNELLQQNFDILNQIMNSKEIKLQQQVLNILLQCQNKKDIPEKLINSLAVLSVSTKVIEVKRQCQNLINLISKAGKKFNNEILQLMISDESVEIQQGKSQYEQISLQTALSQTINNIKVQSNNNDLEILFNDIYHKFRQPFFQFCSQDIDDLLNLQLQFKNSYKKEFLKIFSQILIYHPFYCFNKRIVQKIEEQILKKVINEDFIIIIKAYNNVVRQKCVLNLEKVLDFLADKLQRNNQEKNINLVILECISKAAEVYQIKQNCLSIFEANINNQKKINRRELSLSIKGLLAAQKWGYQSNSFNEWCRFYLNSCFGVQQINHDFELIDLLIQSEYQNFKQLLLKPQKEWNREILLYGLLKKYQQDEKELICQKLLKFQSNPSNQILKSLLNIQDDQNLPFEQLSEIIQFIQIIDIQITKNLLLNNVNYHQNLKLKWIEKLLQTKLQHEINQFYLEKLISKIFYKFNTQLIQKLLNSILEINNLSEFSELLDFVNQNQIEIHEINIQNASVNQLKRSFEISFLFKQIKISTQTSFFKKIKNILDHLLERGWTYEQLNSLFSQLKSLNDQEKIFKEKTLIQIIEILDEYKIPKNNYQDILALMQFENPTNWLKKVNMIAVKNNFQSVGHVKNSKELIEELKSQNIKSQLILNLQDDVLVRQIEQIQSISSNDKVNFYNKFQRINYVISIWDRQNILEWSHYAQSNKDSFKDPDFSIIALAVINRANYLQTKFYMTDSQILTCLIILRRNNQKGMLLQVATGEGKSTIISVLAILNRLLGQKVDIITSSPVLAERDAKEKAGLYNMFGFSCADNNDKKQYFMGAKDCYKKDIVYGEASQFQFDILRDNYSSLGTLAERKFEVAIVDEVDSMLIDDSSKIARLSSTIAGIDQLQVLYYFIWYKLVEIKDYLIEINNKMYIFIDKINYVEDKYVLVYINEKGQEKKISDLKSYIEENQDISEIGKLIEKDIFTFLQEHLERFIQEILESKKIKIPKNFEEFVKKQKPAWIENAILAVQYKENIHYVIHEGLIKPVDYVSTGIVQSSTNWPDGLHQFLQIKHSLKVTSETMTTNFISNMVFFKKYSSNLIGLTGTLGSEKSKDVLSKVYNVDLIFIPSQRKKQFIELTTVLTANEKEWLEEINTSAINEVQKDRGVLIICETIEDAKIVANNIQLQYRQKAVKLYTMNNMNQERGIEKIYPGEIIIATNLAGRGTDIKTDTIEQFGGLHVILTFMPSNQRVEEQAFGRTARQGRCGTGQMILCDQFNNQATKKLRDNLEAQMLDEFMHKELKAIEVKDKLFEQFCKLINTIRDDIRQNIGIYDKFKNSVKSLIKNMMPSVYEINVISAIEEQWSMFLHMINDSTIPIDKALERYQQFSQNIDNDYKNKKIIKNPYYHIAIAFDLVVDDSTFNDNYQKAMEHFDEAIKLDEDFSAAAFAGKAWLLLKGRENFIFSNNQIQGYKQQALELLKKSLTLLNDEIASLQAILQILQFISTDTKSDLFKQLVNKINILGSYVNSLENTALVTKKSLRLFDITVIKKQLKSQLATSYFDMDKNKLCIIEDKINLGNEFEIQFNDLSIIKEKTDQAIETIEAAYSKNFLFQSILKEKYDDISIHLQDLDSQKFQQMLNPDIEVKDLNKEDAIAQLQDKFFFLSKNLLHKEFQGNSYKINLVIKDSDRLINTYNNLDVIQAINIIQNDENDFSQFSLNFKNINKRSKQLNKKLSNQTIIIEFPNLDSNEVRQKIYDIRQNSISLEIQGNKNQLQAAMNLSEGDIVQLLSNEKDKIIIETLYRDEANERLNNSQQTSFCLKLENLNKDKINQILNVSGNAIFAISFKDQIPFKNFNLLIEGKVNITFDKLGESNSKKLIPILRKQNLDFSFKFINLSHNQLYNLIQRAQLDQENIEIIKLRTLSELFTNETQLTLELQEFNFRGFHYLFEINEKRFTPWSSIAIVFALAGIQIAAGIFLTSTGVGVMIGQALITEGAADIITGLRAIYTRKFSWTDYMTQKAISLVISTVSIGVSKIKSEIKALYGAAKTEACQNVGTQFIQKSTKITKTFASQTGKNLTQNALKQTAFKIGEHGLREGLNNISHSLCNLGIEQFRPQIFEYVSENVNQQFCNENLNNLIRKMYCLDNLSKSNNYNQMIENIVIEITNPSSSFLQSTWESIGLPLCQGILSKNSQQNQNLGMQVRIMATLKSIYGIINLINKICNQLLLKLSQISHNKLKISQLLSKHCQIKQSDSNQIVEILKKEDVILVQEIYHKNYLEYVNPSAYETDLNQQISLQKSIKSVSQINFGYYQKYKNKVDSFLKELNNGTLSIKYEEMSPIITLISNQITQQLIAILNQQIIQPWSSYGIGILITNISNKIQNKMINNEIKKDIEDQKNELQNLNENQILTQEQQNQIKDIEAHIQERQNQLKEQQKYSKQIEYISKKCINHQKQETKKQNNNQDQDSKQGKIFEDIQYFLSFQKNFSQDETLKVFKNIFWEFVQSKLDKNEEIEEKMIYFQQNQNIKISKETINLASLIYEEDYQQKMEKKGFIVLEKIDPKITKKYDIVAVFVKKDDKIYIVTKETKYKIQHLIMDFKIYFGNSNEKAINALSNWIQRTIDRLNLDQSHIIGVGHSLGGYLIMSAAIQIKQFFQRVVCFDSPRSDEMIIQYGEPNFEIINFQSSVIGAINYNCDLKNIKLIQIQKSNSENKQNKINLKPIILTTCQFFLDNYLEKGKIQKLFSLICQNYEQGEEVINYISDNLNKHKMEYFHKNLDQYLEN